MTPQPKNPRSKEPVPADSCPPACPAARRSPRTRRSPAFKAPSCQAAASACTRGNGEEQPARAADRLRRGRPLHAGSSPPPGPEGPSPAAGNGPAPSRRPVVRVEDPRRWSGPGRGRWSGPRPRCRPARRVSQQPAAVAGGRRRRAAGSGRRGGGGRRRLTYGVEDADGGLAVGGEQGLGALELQHRRRRHLTAPSLPPQRQTGSGG